jgi:hypothetical protein
MLLLAPMMSNVGPKLGYLFPNPTWKVMVKLATYIATAPKYVLLARQIFWYAQQEQLLREECHYRDAVYGPHWTSLAPIAASCQELLKCGCRISCSGNCKCFRSGLPCSYAAVNCSEFRSFASYKTTTACILAHVQWTYIWNDTVIVCWTPFSLIVSKEIEMLQKQKLKISDKRYENWCHFENRGGHFENGRNLNGQRYFLFRY